jgi:hypothetical protein
VSIAALTPTPKMQFSDTNGIPLAGGFVFTYAAGTSSQLATFTDSTEAAQNTNPVVLDAGGFANIWLGSNAYRFVVQDANGVQQYTTDNITGNNLNALSSSAFVEAALGTGIVGQDVLAGNSATHRLSMSNDGAPFDAIVGQNTVDSLYNKTLFSPVLHLPIIDALGELNPGYIFGDSLTGVDASAKMAAGIAALPAAGGVLDFRHVDDLGGDGSTVIDPGTKTVTILFGPYTYHLSSIIVRTGLRLVGMSEQTTILQATTNTTVALIKGPPTTDPGASGCLFENFRMYAATGFNSNPAPSNSLDGFLFNARSASASGGVLWYSEFRNVEVIGFGANAWHFLGASAVGELGFHQFLTFIGCTGSANGGSNGAGGNALRMEGAMYQFFFLNCQFDSATFNTAIDGSGGNTPNIFLGAGPGAGVAGYPYIINFDGCTCQGRQILVQIDGALDVTFRKMHHEQGFGAYLITEGANGAAVKTRGIGIVESSFNGNVGVNAGNGYILNVNTADAAGISLHHNLYAGVSAGPDSWYVSAAPPSAVFSYNNFIDGATNTFMGGAQVASVVAVYDALTQGANIPATTIWTPPLSGLYEVEVMGVVTRAATTSSVLPAFGIGWTDVDSNVASGAPAFTATQSGNTAGTTRADGRILINAKALQPIQVISYSFASVGATSMQYAVHYRLKFLG